MKYRQFLPAIHSVEPLSCGAARCGYLPLSFGNEIVGKKYPPITQPLYLFSSLVAYKLKAVALGVSVDK